jgi:tight adherence protein B
VLDEALAELLGLLAAPVEAGVPPAVALAAVEPSARDGPLAGLVSDLVDAAGAGRPLAAVWAGWAARWDNSSVGFVGRAWSLSEEAGAPLVDALAAAVDGVQARRRAREHLLTAVAGPRASMRVLSLLPLAGPVVGLACGVGPRALYLSSAAGTVSLALGLVLAALAAAWSRRILARAT